MAAGLKSLFAIWFGGRAGAPLPPKVNVTELATPLAVATPLTLTLGVTAARATALNSNTPQSTSLGAITAQAELTPAS